MKYLMRSAYADWSIWVATIIAVQAVKKEKR